MAPTTRGASRHQPSSPTASGSEYHESNASMEAEEAAQAPNEEEEEEIDYGSSTEEDGPTPRVRSPQVLSRAGSVVVSLAHTSSFT